MRSTSTSRRSPLSVLLVLLLAAVLTPLLGPTVRAVAVPVGCDWPAPVSYDGANILGPDTQASYWLLHYEAVPGTRLRIEGTYPNARYFSFTAQDEEEVSTSAIIDRDIAPDHGSVNSFRQAQRRAGQHYTVHVSFADPPASGPARNTLYVGRTYGGGHNPGGTIVYRVYVPTNQHDPRGGVPLPKVFEETPAGDVRLSLDACQPQLGVLGGPGNAQTESANRPGDLPGLVPANDTYQPVPDFRRLQSGYFTDPAVAALPPAVGGTVPTPGGTPLANLPFPYLASSITRKYGDTLAIRFKAPTFPDTVRGEWVTKRTQTRYWSLCSYAATEEAGLRGNGCATDFLTRPDAHGFVTIVLSDPAHRPDAAIRPAQGVHWLSWGPWDKDYLLMRFGLPAKGWKHSPFLIEPDAVDQVATARRIMGSYYPVARYCSKAKILAHGVDSCF